MHVAGVLVLAVLMAVTSTAKQKKSKRSVDIPTSFHSEESRLVEELMTRYRPYRHLSRPVLNASHTVNVQFELSLLQICDLDEKNQKLTTLVWLKQVWKDEILTWNPADYGGLSSIHLPFNVIWTPDILLYNNVGDEVADVHHELTVVDSDGTVLWMPPAKYESSCKMDMTNFPFDTQLCSLKFGSWAHNMYKLDLNFEKNAASVNMDNYVSSSEWDIDTSAVRVANYYACCSAPYVDLRYSFKLTRKVTFHMKLILIPSILLSILAVFIFWIPPHRPDRTALGLSLFSSFFLLLILVVTTSPPTAAARLGEYYIIVIFLVSIGIVLSISTINISQNIKPCPSFIEKTFIPVFGRILCLDRPSVKVSRPAEKTEGIFSKNPKHTDKSQPDLQPEVADKRPPTLPRGNQEKWRTFALILDRIYFIIFVIAVSITFIVIFPKPIYS